MAGKLISDRKADIQDISYNCKLAKSGVKY